MIPFYILCSKFFLLVCGTMDEHVPCSHSLAISIVNGLTLFFPLLDSSMHVHSHVEKTSPSFDITTGWVASTLQHMAEPQYSVYTLRLSFIHAADLLLRGSVDEFDRRHLCKSFATQPSVTWLGFPFKSHIQRCHL